MPVWTKSKSDPFETLIVTIISQNTADRNTAKAFEKLSKRFEIKPEVLAKAEISEIEESIKTVTSLLTSSYPGIEFNADHDAIGKSIKTVTSLLTSS
jgi:endonuclease III